MLEQICTNDKVNTHSLHSGAGEYDSTQYRCFEQQALNKKMQGVKDLAYGINIDCLSGIYGIDVDMRTYEDGVFYKQIGLYDMFLDTLYMKAGLLDHIEESAFKFLEDVCDASIEYEMARQCVGTPITETYLTFDSAATIDSKVFACCRGVKLPLQNSTKEEIKKCLMAKNLYQQFYALGGFHMRSLTRQQTGVMLECENNEMFHQGIQDSFTDLSYEDRARYYAKSGYPPTYAKNLSLPATISTVNYHHFLRDFAKKVSSSDDYFSAACEACSLGERLGYQAYVYPGMMCPALVAKQYYEPVKNDEICPDKLFFKAQVANYCCLSRAVRFYDFGASYDPQKCPDLSNVLYKVV